MSKQKMRKIMFRKTPSGGYNIAQPSALKEAKALVETGFCVTDLDEEFIVDYLELKEYNSLSSYYEWSCDNNFRFINNEIKIEEMKPELKGCCSFYISDMEGWDDCLVLRESFEKIMNEFLKQENYQHIELAMITQQQEREFREFMSSMTFEEFADLNLSEESIDRAIKIKKRIPQRLTSNEWETWCNRNIHTNF